jgi:hypothetical protein
MMEAFLSALLALCTVSVLMRCLARAGTSAILLLNWVVCSAVAWITHDPYPWLFYIVADYLAALAIYTIRRSHWQSAIMGVYSVQLICHAAYGLSDKSAGPTYYSYWALSCLAWVQVALCGGWVIHGIVGRRLSASGGRFNLGAGLASALATEEKP